jgi:ABC-type uncharacterized transport system fused permease/ATPase subunit
MIWVPMAVSDFIQLSVSMKRVQKFLEVDEVQDNLRVSKDLGKTAFEIKGSFSWGFEEKKKDDEKKEDDDDDNKDKKEEKKKED